RAAAGRRARSPRPAASARHSGETCARGRGRPAARFNHKEERVMAGDKKRGTRRAKAPARGVEKTREAGKGARGGMSAVKDTARATAKVAAKGTRKTARTAMGAAKETARTARKGGGSRARTTSPSRRPRA